MQNGTEHPYLLLDGVTPGRWAKGFICQEGLVCRVSYMTEPFYWLYIGFTQCQETENPLGDTYSFDNIFGSMLIVTITAGSKYHANGRRKRHYAEQVMLQAKHGLSQCTT